MPKKPSYPKQKTPYLCSFCGLSQPATKMLIEGIDAYICESCVQHANDIIHENKTGTAFQDGFSLRTPADIKKALDKYIIGQDHAKKTVSVAVYNHYQRITN
ncbi:MAG: ClpX C4-type zinc finger protein, partial [Fidelibacterota bacterium]